jgi:hypothetical protein
MRWREPALSSFRFGSVADVTAINRVSVLCQERTLLIKRDP